MNNIYVEVIIRGIRDGREWQKTVLVEPEQTQASYHAMEKRLGMAMIQIGDEVRNTVKKA